ncbi:copper amine oxidase N-terminal domain-containing protein [Paenibacillus macquariensis]|uniref:Copper amine oxidase N-terminal domain-containing protein n=1 Tax=Paenibacillus macquariensis TaxID=948756 RepID=A0ABY1JZQ3_9BACL|nr:copper amine oxidase N-terminal domain-containing protein [Paenibacillus macquariensis]MEC0091316.1 copper amine oxidase N-terminal domain-containing protein [Paenibacillus macquariensis]OAB38006.1 hypothetical protein PMSM_02380 [Paenibacillus macquariensis subsp. macquariensis]SIR04183.1 Copper amine oxidase N-terminal domain-containing protein [Paenibacillus macquariensis]
MKKVISTVVILSLLSVGSIANAAKPISIFVEDKEIQSTVAPILEQGRVLVPIRVVAESLGAKVTWDQKMNTVTIRKWSESVILTLGKKTVSRDGKPNESGVIDLDVSVQKENNRIYVPLRFLSQQYGYIVDWNGKSITIKSPLSNKERMTLYEGSLKDARTLVKKMTYSSNVHYQNKPLEVSYDTEDYTQTFIFPEGEALRYYVLQGDTVSQYEFIDDFPIVTWQAHLQKGEQLRNFLDNKFMDQKGTPTQINKKFLYYATSMMGDSNSEESGQIDLKRVITSTGSKNSVGGDVVKSEGKISLELPDEARKEMNRD